ncbi:hypothetical protein FGO68_gene10570 [Halteria grandinella]|uniref:CENP-V/GFA domain-containing protein n=1 Tax=Halteria grandinella TaxID=5974 RepID=A0A8J8P1Q4_HALGN|nr:hypothetical protein FGO68_gene10570 [Halteria grandinella]
MEGSLITVTGGCHCQSVRFSLTTPSSISVYKCNCSICAMKQNHHFMIQKDQLTFTAGDLSSLTEYTFNTGVAKHLFCTKCGVCPFYSPRSNPDCWAVTVYCVDSWKSAFEKIEWVEFDGENWEKQYEVSDIKKHSK